MNLLHKVLAKLRSQLTVVHYKMDFTLLNFNSILFENKIQLKLFQKFKHKLLMCIFSDT